MWALIKKKQGATVVSPRVSRRDEQVERGLGLEKIDRHRGHRGNTSGN